MNSPTKVPIKEFTTTFGSLASYDVFKSSAAFLDATHNGHGKLILLEKRAGITILTMNATKY